MKKRPNFYILIYIFAILVLVAVFCIIIWKLLFMLPCNDPAQKACVMDGTSVAGLAAAILGIAATLLAFLGAFAVAYWWAHLDKKVNTQVDKRIDREVDRRLQEQEQKFQDQISRVESQVTPLETDVQKVATQISQLNMQIVQLDAQLQEAKKIPIISATLVDPWRVEDWAHEILATEPVSEVSFYMVRSYLKIVDEILSLLNIASVGAYLPQLAKKREYYSQHGPSGSPLYYWGKALEWQKIVDNQPNQPYSEASKREIDRRRPGIEAYQKQQRSLDSHP